MKNHKRLQSWFRQLDVWYRHIHLLLQFTINWATTNANFYCYISSNRIIKQPMNAYFDGNVHLRKSVHVNTLDLYQQETVDRSCFSREICDFAYSHGLAHFSVSRLCVCVLLSFAQIAYWRKSKCNITFKGFDISHPMTPLRRLYSVPLT